ncbi:DNA polymerase [Bacillus phage VMY22]|uniref:DNA polymerase n=1 Tax=Bacillus phage VMY22 TaxID=1734382 RepID=A0A0N9S829_9CAUD|nr:DNA polymerase [Bacillus phage VMY22]ALH46472.1 DNA polymerase [Bacillus phage VMY22]
MATKKRKAYSCDFEATTSTYSETETRVWAYGWMEIGNTSHFNIGDNLDEFMLWTSKECADLYFHNLRYDGEFIVNWLLHKGYECNESGRPKTFDTVISKGGQWYKIAIHHEGKGTTQIFDSLKKLPFPVKTIAKAFKLPVLKGDIDYNLHRDENHVITSEEFTYIKHDIEIVARALDIQINQQGLVKMTNGADSMDHFIKSLDKKKKVAERIYNQYFPKMSIAMDSIFRKAYRGGFTWVNPKFKGQEVGEGMVFDVNSLYPSVMYYKPLPWGKPVPFVGKYEEDPDFPLYICHIKTGFVLKEGHIPTIQIKKNPIFQENEYLETSGGAPVDLHVTNVDLELIKEHYELYDTEYVGGWKFRQQTGIFNNFIDYWMKIKTDPKSTPAIVTLAKLQLNSLYGKFASHPDVTGKVPYLKDDGSTAFKKGLPKSKDPVYTPAGAFITAWARHMTITTAQKVYDRILYCDTDSIHILGIDIPEAIKNDIHQKELGKWAFECMFKRAKFVRQKTYVEDMYAKFMSYWEDGELNYMLKECVKEEATARLLNVKCAGMPQAVKKFVTFRTFAVGFTSDTGKLKPKHVKGGQILVDVPFTIK